MKMNPVIELAHFLLSAMVSISFIVILPFTEIGVSVILSIVLFSLMVVCMLLANLVPRSAIFVLLWVSMNSRSNVS
jgi:hypothetical protein